MMHRTAMFALGLATGLIVLGYLAPGLAQDQPQANPDQPVEAADDDATADEVLEDLLQRREDSPLIDPARPDEVSPPREPEERQSLRALAGVAPDAELELRREGQFIITRRGRMVRAPGDGTGWVFVFEADGGRMQDPPMYLMPCQLLEDMEQIVQEHGDSVVFVLSGQVFLYRGANYLLPTLMQLAPDRGNLQR